MMAASAFFSSGRSPASSRVAIEAPDTYSPMMNGYWMPAWSSAPASVKRMTFAWLTICMVWI
jgi:hypothetical protein